MSIPSVVGFDLDDTLYDRDVLYEETFLLMEHTAVKTGVPFDTFNAVYQAASLKEFSLYAKGLKSEQQYRIDRILQTYRHFGFDLSREKAQIYQAWYEIKKGQLAWRSGAEELLRYLKDSNCTLFVMTNGAGVVQRKKLAQLDVQTYIPPSHWFISEEWGMAKPDRGFFDQVSEKLCVDADKIAFIGDHYENDIIGARNAGWTPLYLNVRIEEPDDKHILTFDDFHALLEWFKHVMK